MLLRRSFVREIMHEFIIHNRPWFVNLILPKTPHCMFIQHVPTTKKNKSVAKLYCKRTSQYIKLIESAHDILYTEMKKHSRRLLIVIVGLILAMCSAAFTYSIAIQSAKLSGNTSAALFFQSTATPQPEDQSEVGSTDGIVVLGGVIALIVIIPIFLRRNDWMRSQ